MQIYPILIVVAVLLADGSMRTQVAGGPDDGWLPAAVAVGGPLLAILGAWIGVRGCVRGLDRSGSHRLILRAERIMRWARGVVLLAHGVALLLLGWLDVVRAVVGDLIVIDELLIIAIPSVALSLLWCVYYPIERRLREALLIRHLDHGDPIYPMPTRLQYVLVQVRIGLLLLLVPLLLILTAGEFIAWGAQRPWMPAVQPWVIEALTAGAALLVFLFSPLLARGLLHLEPLPRGTTRNDLLHVCEAQDVKVREILLWRTGGSMVNAAVMGMISPLRYVMLTDVLMESLDRRALQAVMAHEIGHVRRHHMPWLLAALLACVAVSQLVVLGPVTLLRWCGVTWSVQVSHWMGISLTCVALLLALQLFGWVSRRFERQADTFAVQHLSMQPIAMSEDADRSTPEATDEEPPPAATAVSPLAGPDMADVDVQVASDAEVGLVRHSAVEAMQRALQRIADLNAIDPHRRSWRHGSIAWRQAYLREILGRPLSNLPIDRRVKQIKLATVVALLLAGGSLLVETLLADDPPPPETVWTWTGDTLSVLDAGEQP
jgi:STE24 endopeptidase